MRFEAKEHGHLLGIGFVTRGDILEWNGSKRAWLKPLDKEYPEELGPPKPAPAKLKRKRA